MGIKDSFFVATLKVVQNCFLLLGFRPVKYLLLEARRALTTVFRSLEYLAISILYIYMIPQPTRDLALLRCTQLPRDGHTLFYAARQHSSVVHRMLAIVTRRSLSPERLAARDYNYSTLPFTVCTCSGSLFTLDNAKYTHGNKSYMP